MTNFSWLTSLADIMLYESVSSGYLLLYCLCHVVDFLVPQRWSRAQIPFFDLLQHIRYYLSMSVCVFVFLWSW